MARTPLLSNLQGIAAHLRAAEAQGLPPSAGAGAGAAAGAGGSGLTRRDLLKAAGAASLVVACAPRTMLKSFAAGAQPVIAVVGGGLAGLCAAWRLKHHGVIATVYEASTRAGGRVDTDTTTFAGDRTGSQRVERGGELIDSGHKHYRKLIHHLGLKLDNLHAAQAKGTKDLGYFDGQPYTVAQTAADFAAVFPLLQQDVEDAGYPTLHDAFTPAGLALDQMSITEWIESRVPGGNASRFGQLLAVAYNIEYGAEPEQQSALNLVYLLGFGSTPGHFSIFGASDERSRVHGGNAQVPQRLADHLGAAVKLEHRLLAAATVGNGQTQLTFDTPGGVQDVTADRVIMTLPFAVLRAAVDLSALQLSPLKQVAIAELGMGTNSKLHVQFGSRPWVALGNTGATTSDQGYQNTWEETRAQPGSAGILVNYTGGTLGSSFGSGTPQQRAQQFLAQIEPVLPGLGATWNGKASVDFWLGSPFQLGSYSYWKVGQYTQFSGIEGAVEGTVHFAGEHTSTDFQGFMEGAVQTGQRAADEVLAAI